MTRYTSHTLIVVLFVSMACSLHAAEPMAGPFPFAIPQYDYSDWSDRPDQFIVVDRGGLHGRGEYAGQPDTVLMADGKTILVTFPLGHGGPHTMLRRSLDGGKTWSPRLKVPASFMGRHNAACLHRMTNPKDGKERLILHVSHDRKQQSPTMIYSVSDDGGTHWTEFKNVFPAELAGTAGYRGYAPSKTGVRMSNGRHLWMYHDRVPPNNRDIVLVQTTTPDGGLTWGRPVIVGDKSDFPDSAPAEPELIVSPDGKQWLVIARENTRRYQSLMMVSNDEGKSWSAFRETNPSLTGDRHVARYAPDGRLLITFRSRSRNIDRSHDATYGDFVAWVGTYKDIVQGRPGQYRVRLINQLPDPSADTGYAGLEILPDGTFVSTTYANWTDDGKKNNDVITMRFTIKELDWLAGLNNSVDPSSSAMPESACTRDTENE